MNPELETFITEVWALILKELLAQHDKNTSMGMHVSLEQMQRALLSFGQTNVKHSPMPSIAPFAASMENPTYAQLLPKAQENEVPILHFNKNQSPSKNALILNTQKSDEKPDEKPDLSFTIVITEKPQQVLNNEGTSRQKTTTTQNLEKLLLESLLRSRNQDYLLPLFEECRLGTRKHQRGLVKNEQTALKELFPHKRNNATIIERIKNNKVDLEELFGLSRKCELVKKKKVFCKKNERQIKNLSKKLVQRLEDEQKSSGFYENNIRLWIKKELTTLTAKMRLCYEDEAGKLNFYGNTQGLKHLRNWEAEAADINHIEVILTHYPNLFLSKNETEQFFESYMDFLSKQGLTQESDGNKIYEMWKKASSSSSRHSELNEYLAVNYSYYHRMNKNKLTKGIEEPRFKFLKQFVTTINECNELLEIGCPDDNNALKKFFLPLLNEVVSVLNEWILNGRNAQIYELIPLRAKISEIYSTIHAVLLKKPIASIEHKLKIRGIDYPIVHATPETTMTPSRTWSVIDLQWSTSIPGSEAKYLNLMFAIILQNLHKLVGNEYETESDKEEIPFNAYDIEFNRFIFDIHYNMLSDHLKLANKIFVEHRMKLFELSKNNPFGKASPSSSCYGFWRVSKNGHHYTNWPPEKAHRGEVKIEMDVVEEGLQVLGLK